MRFLAALSNNDWIATYDDLIVVQDDKGGASSMAFRSMASVKSDSKKQKYEKNSKNNLQIIIHKNNVLRKLIDHCEKKLIHRIVWYMYMYMY